MQEFVLVVEIRIKPENRAAFMAGLEENARAARKEPGCLAFEILVNPQDPCQVMLHEVYANAAAFETHQQTPHFKRYLESAVPLLDSRERRFWTRVAP